MRMGTGDRTGDVWGRPVPRLLVDEKRDEQRAHGSRDREDRDKIGPDGTRDIFADHHALTLAKCFMPPISQSGVTGRLHREGSKCCVPGTPSE